MMIMVVMAKLYLIQGMFSNLVLVNLVLCCGALSRVQLVTPWTVARQALLSSVYGDAPGKNTGVGCRALLQGIFPTHVSCIAGRVFTI